MKKELLTKLPTIMLKIMNFPNIPYATAWLSYLKSKKQRLSSILASSPTEKETLSENNMALIISLSILLSLAWMITPLPTPKNMLNSTIKRTTEQPVHWISTPKITAMTSQNAHLGSIISAPTRHLKNLITSVILKGITFESNSNKLNVSSYATLNIVAKKIKRIPAEKHFTLAGHSDNIGLDTKNKMLSTQRAESVMSYLISQGVKAERLNSVGYGNSLPIADNNTAIGRKTNRRVELSMH